MVPEHAFEATTIDAWDDGNPKNPFNAFNVQLLVFPPLSEADKFHFEWFFDWFLLIVFHVTWPSPSCFLPNLFELDWQARFPWCNPQGGTNASISGELHTVYGFHRFL